MSPRNPEQFKQIREEKKALILETALRLFAENGYHSTSISKITGEAGISKGLLYNYFENKQDLLRHIFNDVVDKIMANLDTNRDNIITTKEAEQFFDIFFDNLIENPEEWKLLYQLFIQQDVMEFLLEENHNNQFEASQKVLFDYFISRDFEDPEMAMLLFSSLLKGFVMQYALAPHFFTREVVDKFKNKMKQMFVLEKSKSIDTDKKIDDYTGYLLL